MTTFDTSSQSPDSPDALPRRDEAIAQSPDCAEYYEDRGNSLQTAQSFAEALASYDRAIALKPDFAQAHCHRANALRSLGRLDDAILSYDAAIALKSDYPEAYNNRGNTLRDLKRIEAALESYDAAIALMPRHPALYCNRGNALQELDRFEEAIAAYDRATALKPDYAEAYSNRAVALHNLKRFAEAISNLNSALALRPNYAEARWNRALSYLITGRFDLGWADHEARKIRRQPVGNSAFDKPLWLGQTEVSGKTILVHSEQGFGDTIQFCRYVKLLVDADAKVLFAPQAPVRGLMRSLGAQLVDAADSDLTFDLHCPLMSLPLAFGTEPSTIPSATNILSVDPDKQRAWAQRLGTKIKPRIGVAWSGSIEHKNDLRRSIDLGTFRRIFNDSYDLISLHKELRASDRSAMEDVKLTHFGDELRDFSDTAALCQLMDLVISVDTAVAHLAGTLSKPVWLLLPWVPDWRWMVDGDSSSWYPSMRLFRQSGRGDWNNVLDSVESELASRPAMSTRS